MRGDTVASDTVRLGRLHSAFIAGFAFFATMMLFAAAVILIDAPILNLILWVGIPLSSPFLWLLDLFIQPGEPWGSAVRWVFMERPSLFLLGSLSLDPFFIYGIFVGLMFTLKSGSFREVVKSIAIRLFLALLVIGVVAACITFHALSHDS